MRLLVICPYPQGKAPSQRFRFEQYLDRLEVKYAMKSFWKDSEWPTIYQQGGVGFKITRTVLGFLRRLWLLLTVARYDRVFIHREATPIGPPWMEWTIARIWRKPIIFDFDDAIWLPNASKANEKLAGKLKFHGKTAKICSWATTCSVGNSFLAEYASQFCKDVRIIPTTIDTEHHHNPDLYTRVGSKWVKKESAFSEDKKSDERPLASSRWPMANDLDSGNLVSEITDVELQNGEQKSTGSSLTEEQLESRSLKPEAPEQSTESSSTEQELTANSQQLTAVDVHNDPRKDSEKISNSSNTNLVTIGWTGTHSTIKQLTPLFPLLEKIHRQHPFRFLLIADIPPDEIPDFVEFRPWNKETEIKDLMDINIGLMPLYNTDWEKGKCGFKALQYMALGKPAVTSAVGVNIEIIENQEQGYLCESLPFNQTLKWKNALIDLIQDENKRKEIGEVGRKRIISAYSVLSHIEAYRQLLS